MKVIILNQTKYKEKDCIYSCISENEFFSFQAKGALETKSQFVFLNNPLTVADIDLLQDGRYKYKVAKSASIVSVPYKGSDKLDYLFTVSAVAELTIKALLDEEKHLLYEDLLEVLNALRAEKDPLMVLNIFVARILKLSGTQFEVDKCVSCGARSDIVAFSFEDGGFVCRKCATNDTKRDLLPAQMKIVRYAFKAKDYSCTQTEEYSKVDKIYVLKKFKDFLNESLGVDIKSIDALLK